MKDSNIFMKILMFLRKILIENRGISLEPDIKTGKPELDRIIKEYREEVGK
jgi:hypothetical protein